MTQGVGFEATIVSKRKNTILFSVAKENRFLDKISGSYLSDSYTLLATKAPCGFRLYKNFFPMTNDNSSVHDGHRTVGNKSLPKVFRVRVHAVAAILSLQHQDNDVR
jgi:hypothetical protein